LPARLAVAVETEPKTTKYEVTVSVQGSGASLRSQFVKATAVWMPQDHGVDFSRIYPRSMRSRQHCVAIRAQPRVTRILPAMRSAALAQPSPSAGRCES